MIRCEILGIIKLMICLLTMSLITLSTWTGGSIREAKAAVSGDFVYIISNSEVTITDYIGTDTEVDIPATLDKFPVTGIGFDAFSDNQLASVTISNSITSVEDHPIFFRKEKCDR